MEQALAQEHIAKIEKQIKPVFCGRFSVRGRSATETRFHRVNCKCWNCHRCGPVKAGRYKHVIRESAERHNLRRFLTLTLDPKVNPGVTAAEHSDYLAHFDLYREKSGRCECDACEKTRGASLLHIRECWNKFRTYLKRAFDEAVTFIAVVEFQKKTGFAHLHVLIDRYISQSWVSDVWERIGGGAQVNIKVIDLHRISNYLSKYLTKELLQSAPARSRRVTCSRNIKLNAKPEKGEHVWQLVKTPIQELFRRNGWRLIVEEGYDAEQNLQNFVIRELNLMLPRWAAKQRISWKKNQPTFIA